MKKTVIEPHKSSLGMEANIAVIIVYAAMAVVSWMSYLGWFAWVVPLAFFYIEKESKFVKFQSAQALLIGVASAAVSIVLRIFIWILTPRDIYSTLNYVMGRGWGAWRLVGTLATIFGIAFTLLEAYIIFNAYFYKQVELPAVGPAVVKVSEKLENYQPKQ